MMHFMVRHLLGMSIGGAFLMDEVAADGGDGGGGDPVAAAPAAAPAATPAAEPAKTSVLDAPTLLADKPGDPAAEPAKADAVAVDGAPEAYEAFTFTEGLEVDDEVMGDFQAVAKELNLPQGSAQKIIDLQTKVEQKRTERLEAALTEQRERWAKEVRDDPEIGGEKYDETVKVAVKTMQAFATPELRSLLIESGIGNHPAMVKFCHAIGKSLSEDSMVMPGTQSGGKEKTRAADVLFPNL